jgi:hypothetical protein
MYSTWPTTWSAVGPQAIERPKQWTGRGQGLLDPTAYVDVDGTIAPHVRAAAAYGCAPRSTRHFHLVCTARRRRHTTPNQQGPRVAV